MAPGYLPKFVPKLRVERLMNLSPCERCLIPAGVKWLFYDWKNIYWEWCLGFFLGQIASLIANLRHWRQHYLSSIWITHVNAACFGKSSYLIKEDFPGLPDFFSHISLWIALYKKLILFYEYLAGQTRLQLSCDGSKLWQGQFARLSLAKIC